MQTLVDLLADMQALGGREALRYHDGYRTWKLSYQQLYSRIGAFVRYLDEKRFSKGERILLWGENRPEWVSVFWGCLVRGVTVVPLDFRSSPEFVGRIQREAQARLLIFGRSVTPDGVEIEQLSFDDVGEFSEAESFSAPDISPNDIVEIVYTSGTTGEPKGVVHRHRNICANLNPIHREIGRYRALARPFQPIRILDLLPLSHMFGQTVGVFAPVMLGGAAVFMDEMHPGAILQTISRERVSVLAAVPQFLRNLRNEVARKFELPERSPRWKGIPGAAERWWLHRTVHWRLGLKFWALIVGGAQLDPEIERFWSRLGFVVVQGYGLTETSPVVTVNNPFHPGRGSIGKAIAGQEVKIAPDGEILVRGESVVSEYLGGGSESGTRFEGGWLHTGDIGEIDAEGRLYFKGRKKDVIVTPEGLNVFPQDIEAKLNNLPEVKDTTVVAVTKNGEERIHAALILRDPSAKPEELVRRVNAQLERHQRIRSWSLWPEEDFPRTPSTMKIKRNEVARSLGVEKGDRGAAGGDRRGGARGVKGALAEMTGRDGSELEGSMKLSEDLGISSLEKVELLSRLENELGVDLDEEQFAGVSTIQELEACVRQAGEVEGGRREKPSEPEPPRAVTTETPLEGGPGEEMQAPMAERPSPEPRPASESRPSPGADRGRPGRLFVLPRWNRFGPICWIRRALQETAVLPMFRQPVKLRVRGLENLDGIAPPVIFAANHTSHFDTVAVLAALPFRWRRRLAPAMSQDYFRAYFEPERFPLKERLKMAGQFLLAAGLFNAYPLPQQMGGTRRALKYTGELVDHGYCPLVFPEGERSPTGEMQRFKSGIGLMAVRLRIPVVPIYIQGLYQVFSMHHEWPEPGTVHVTFGPPLEFKRELDFEKAARRVEEAVRGLALR